MRKKITVLGAGMVGRAIIEDLADEFEVTAIDAKPEVFRRIRQRGVHVEWGDLRQPSIVSGIIKDADLVIGAVPGFMGYKTLETVITEGKNVVDISFFPENAFALDELAKKMGVTAVYDCGVAPGMDNVFFGYHSKLMSIKRFRCLVGGLPFERKHPWQYKAPFSPVDVMEEYTRCARWIENGGIVSKDPLTDIERIRIKGAGTLQAFNTDGLRSILTTHKALAPLLEYAIEKTLRYPGFAERILDLKAMGFLGKQPVKLPGGQIVNMFDITCAKLIQDWKLGEDEREFTVMRVEIEGESAKGRTRVVYDLFDKYDRATGMSSMARTTGYTATGAARLVLDGKFARKGICPPEYLGAEAGCLDLMLAHLKKRGVVYRKTVK
jgi:lysine 6-dehydrogenase